MGYVLLPTTKGQKMMIVIGKGGEGKSRIGRALWALLGDSMNTGSIFKVGKFFVRPKEEWVFFEDVFETKLAYLIQRIGTEYLKNRRNKDFRHIWRDRKPFSFYDSSYSDMKQK